MNDYTYSGRNFDTEENGTRHEMDINRIKSTYPDAEPTPEPKRTYRRERKPTRQVEGETAEVNNSDMSRRQRRNVSRQNENISDKHYTEPARSDRDVNREKVANGSPSLFSRIVNFITDSRTKKIAGVILLVLSAYLAIAAISFMAEGTDDQSVVTSSTTEQIAANPDSVGNVGGAVGAKVSHHLFVEGLGLGSIVMIIYIAVLGLALIGVKKIKFWSFTFKSLLFAITISMVLGLICINSDSAIPLGGYHGLEINRMLIAYTNPLGAIMVSVLLVGILVVIYIAELASLYRRSREKIRTIQAKRDLENDRRRRREQEVREAMADGPINNSITSEHESNVDDGEPEAIVINDDFPQSLESKPAVATSFTDLEDIPAANNDFIPENALNVKPNEVVSASHVNGNSAHEDIADDIDSAENEVDSDATVGHEKVNDEKQSAEVDPNFAVTQAAEIEQATSENSSYEVQGEYDPKADLSRFRMPPVTLLKDRQKSDNNVDLEEQEANKARITKVLSDYGIEITKIEAIVGPTVTLYKIVPAEGVRIAKIKRLEDDIAMSLAALGIRIIAPIPGESNIGIEVPNKEPQTVSIRSILGSKAYQDSKCQLPMALGATINNEVFITDLAKMPHLLVAGATGQGKSVGLNTIIASLIYKRHPSELKFVLVDPKMVEFSLYSCLEKHYLAKIPDAEEAIITDWTKVVDTLNSLCVEMDNRYQLLKNAQCRSITEYNEKFVHRRLNPEKGHRYLPYIVMIVDEFADLIMMAGKSVEAPIARIAQKARAVGMHLIIATQRPSTNVITGMIKANFPGRIAFAVRQRVDSQTILDCPGANQLIGKGDMLISTGGPLQRVQCAFISTEEVEALCHYINDQIGFPTAYILPDPPTEAAEGGGAGAVSLSDRDPYFDEIARMVVQSNTASTSNIQRKYSIGYNRAGKIMDQLEMVGVVGPASGGKPRQVLMSPEDVEMLLSTL